jgi:hypothetical protein
MFMLLMKTRTRKVMHLSSPPSTTRLKAKILKHSEEAIIASIVKQTVKQTRDVRWVHS